MNSDTYEMGLRLWAKWTEMWNGRPALARELVAARFVLHLPLPHSVDPSTVTNAATVERWVTEQRGQYTSIKFHYEAGPFVDTVAGAVAGPWSAEILSGGVTRRACGMDTIAFRDGKICEYWTVARDAETVADWTKAALPAV